MSTLASTAVYLTSKFTTAMELVDKYETGKDQSTVGYVRLCKRNYSRLGR
jgi:hypothetical protein